MRRITYATVAVALLVVTAGCTALIGPSPDGGTAGGSGSAAAVSGAETLPATSGGRSITVSARGVAEAQPNRIHVRLGAVETAEDPGTARRELARNVSRVRSALRQAGVPAENITTTDYDIRYDEDPELAADGPYRATHGLRVTVSSLDRAGTVVDTAVDTGAKRIDGVRFELSTERRRDLRERALRDAMGNARSQAAVVAAGANLTLAGVHDVRTVSADGPSLPRETAFVTAAGGGGTEFAGGPATVEVVVRVTYNATPA